MTTKTKQADPRNHKISRHSQTLSPRIMKLRKDWKTRCRELTGPKQSIHDHNPVNTLASFKPMGDPSCFINYKKPVSISGSSLIEGISVGAKTETRIETPMYRTGRNREYSGMKL